MSAIITTANDAISYINSLYESDSTPPSSGDEDFSVWLSLLNIAVNIWENEEGMLWKELFVKLADASTGDKVTVGGETSYDCPDDFKFPASGFVWLGSETSKIPFQVISIEKAMLREADTGNWCYFTAAGTLEFNPNLDDSMFDGYDINYDYYKFATKLTTGSSTFEMSDPMFAVYYALSELKKDEGDTSALNIATQKLEGMRTKNSTPAWSQDSTEFSPSDEGLGI